MKNAYLSLDLFNNSESKTTILVHDELSLEGGHGGPPFLGFYGKEIYNQNNIRLGVYLIPSMGDLYPKDFTTITLRGEKVLIPAGFEDLYVNSTKTLNIENIEMVKQIASKYLESGSEYIDWNKYVEFEKELIDYLFGNFSNISPNAK